MAPAPRFSVEEEQQLVLDSAAACIADSSIMGFTIGAIAKTAGLSVGSIYKHVQSKEDILVALATRLYQHTLQVYSAVLSADLSDPERIISLNLLDPNKTRLYPFDEHLNTLVASEAILSKASQNWLFQLRQAASAMDELFSRFFQNALDSGHLVLESESEVDEQQQLQQLSMGLWSMCAGFQHIAMQRHVRGSSEIEAELTFPLHANDYPIVCTQRLLNSYSWTAPLCREGIERACSSLTAMGLR